MEPDVNVFLDTIEDNYLQFEELFNFSANTFMSDANKIFESNTLPVLDIPFSALDYLALRSNK